MYFNYFFPGRRTVKLDDLLQAGLGYVFEPESAATPQATFTPCPVYNGPGGQNGVVVSPCDQFVGYYQQAQTWKQEIDCDYWVGMWPDKRPTPETLQRENIIDGTMLRLDDGHAWMIPKARHYEELDGDILYRPGLPARLTRGESGQWFGGEVKKKYRELWRLTTAYIEAQVNAIPDENGMVRIRFSEVDNLVIEAFKCNYKVSAIELDLLGVYDNTVRDRVLQIVTDLDSWEVLVKKKLAILATGSSIDGPAESLPDAAMDITGQPSPT